MHYRGEAFILRLLYTSFVTTIHYPLHTTTETDDTFLVPTTIKHSGSLLDSVLHIPSTHTTTQLLPGSAVCCGVATLLWPLWSLCGDWLWSSVEFTAGWGPCGVRGRLVICWTSTLRHLFTETACQWDLLLIVMITLRWSSRTICAI